MRAPAGGRSSASIAFHAGAHRRRRHLARRPGGIARRLRGAAPEATTAAVQAVFDDGGGRSRRCGDDGHHPQRRRALRLGRARSSTPYGRVLLAKVALLAGIAMLGAMNRWRSVPRAASTLQPLRRVASAELALAAAAVGGRGVLGTLAPPAAQPGDRGIAASGCGLRHDRPRPPDRRLRLSRPQPLRGPRRRLRFGRRRCAPIASACALPRSTIRASHPRRSRSARRPTAASRGSGANLSIDGRWRISVLVERAGNSVDVPLEIETRTTPQRRLDRAHPRPGPELHGGRAEAGVGAVFGRSRAPGPQPGDRRRAST